MRDVKYDHDAERQYECFDCGTIMNVAANPASCPDCGGEVRNRMTPIE